MTALHDDTLHDTAALVATTRGDERTAHLLALQALLRVDGGGYLLPSGEVSRTARTALRAWVAQARGLDAPQAGRPRTRAAVERRDGPGRPELGHVRMTVSVPPDVADALRAEGPSAMVTRLVRASGRAR